MSATPPRPDRSDGQPLSPFAKWCAAALVVGGVVAIWKPWRQDLQDDMPDRALLRLRMVRWFRDDLAAALSQEPAHERQLRHALARIEAEPEKWMGCSTESEVMRLKADLTKKLATVSERR